MADGSSLDAPITAVTVFQDGARVANFSLSRGAVLDNLAIVTLAMQ